MKEGFNMKIKEMEQRTGIRSANIRYYEKMGLLVPKREKASNYREYSEEDLETLNKIKILRLIGVPISDIQKLGQGECSLDQVIEERLAQLEKEAQNIADVKGICNTILKNRIQLDDLNEDVLTGEEKIWRKRLEKIWKEDIDRMLLLKGTLLMLAAAALLFATKLAYSVSFSGEWELDPDPQKATVLFYVGLFLILYGFVWALIEGHDDMPFLYCYSTRYWAAPGMGILTNSFSLCGIGIGIGAKSGIHFVKLFILICIVLVIVRSLIMYRHSRRKIN